MNSFLFCLSVLTARYRVALRDRLVEAGDGQVAPAPADGSTIGYLLGGGRGSVPAQVELVNDEMGWWVAVACLNLFSMFCYVLCLAWSPLATTGHPLLACGEATLCMLCARPATVQPRTMPQ